MNATQHELLLDREEAAALLRLSVWTVDRLRERGKLVGVRTSANRVAITRASVLAHIERETDGAHLTTSTPSRGRKRRDAFPLREQALEQRQNARNAA